MKIALLHLSDIHFKADNNIIIKRLDKIVAAVKPHLFEIENLFLIVSGDIAYSGKVDEYKVAYDFLIKLKSDLSIKNLPISLVIVPGNHDCNFDNESDIRVKFIENLENGNTQKIDDYVIKECTINQKDYFNFVKKLLGKSSETIYNNELLKIEVYSISGKKIAFIQYNTSWLSVLKEKAGSLYYPIDKLNMDLFKIDVDLIISILHHPFNWFIPENKRIFQRHLENSSDIVLTGHEHESSKSIKWDLNENITEYLEGAVLQNSNNHSGFNLIIVDFESQLQKIFFFTWNNSLYHTEDLEKEWIKFLRAKKLIREKFRINDQFFGILNDPGASFIHPNKTESLILKDFFIYPNLMKINSDDTKEKLLNKEITSAKILNNINPNENKIIVSGAEKTGKSSLCKILFSHYHQMGYLPILIEGNDIKTASFEDFEKLIRLTYETQYSKESLQDFIQETNEKKILIIDDFEKSKPNTKYKAVLLENISKNYPNLVVTTGELFLLEEFMTEEDIAPRIFNNFNKYKILEFGHLLRSKLVRRWYWLGNEEIAEESDIITKHDQAIIIINTIIGNNYIPSLPFFLITILQTIETQNTNLKASSYGYYYEFLITQSLKKANIKNEELEGFYNYITELANRIFENKIYRISYENLKIFNKWYNEEYSINIDFNEMILKLINAGIVEKYGDSYRFKYKYIFYYFEAKYIANNISSSEIRNRVSEFCSKIYKEEYSNIIMFLTHLLRDPFIITEVINNAKLVFKDFKPIYFNEDTKVINDLLKDVPQIVLKQKDVIKAREERLDKLDKIDNENHIDKKEPFDDFEEKEKKINAVTELNIAFKSIEIIGQILKNYFGSIKGPQKYELGLEAYHVGLRSLNTFLKFFTDNISVMVEDISKEIVKKKISDKDEIESVSKKILFGFCCVIAFSFIKKISESVGSSFLTETFKEIVFNNNFNSIKLIDLSIKLDHIHTIPIDDLKELKKDFAKDYLPYIVLKRLVIDHIYMFPLDFDEKQKICALLDIPIDSQVIIEETTTQKKTD